MLFKYENEIAEIGFSEIAGAGRNKRKAKVSELNNIRILADTSAVELYLNDGEIVFSTRYYPDREDLQLKVKGGKFRGNLWNLRKMIFTKKENKRIIKQVGKKIRSRFPCLLF